jgi:hypothetical protein
MMVYTKKQFGHALEEKLNLGYDAVRIARWAFDQVFIAPDIKLEDGLRSVLLKIIAMEQGPEFEFSEPELRDLAHELMEQA